jgi:hypothetical protein
MPTLRFASVPARLRWVAISVLATLAACSQAPQPEVKKKPVEPPKPVTGLSAIFKMYQLARTWAPDAMPLRMQSINLESVKSDGGKAGCWRATFVSESRKQQRTYTWSAIEGEGFHKDAFAQQEESYMGSTRQSRPFRIEALKTDTEKAWTIASAKAADYIKKNPDTPVFFQVEYGDRFPNPAWRVIWGESISKSNYSIFVDTATADFLQIGR